MRKLAVLVAVAVLPVVALAGRAESAPAGCGFPGKTWTSTSPAAVDLDAAKLQDALDFATQHTSATVARRPARVPRRRAPGSTR